jgi:hypothetical protein
LFRKEDFQSPASSPLYRDLMSLGNPELQEVVAQLFTLYRTRMDQVPPLGQLVNPYIKVEKMLRGRQWGAAVQWLNRRGHFQDAPEYLQPLIRQAYEHVCREEAWAEFAKIPGETSEAVDRQVVQAWNESLFAGFGPAEKERMRVAEARRRVGLLDRLFHLAQQLGNRVSHSGEKKLVEAAAKLPEGYQYTLRGRVELARRRMNSLNRLVHVIRHPTSEAAIVAAWRAVVEVKCDKLVDIERVARVTLAEERAPVLKALSDVPAELPDEERKERVRSLWREDLLGNCPEADKWRRIVEGVAS